MSGRGLFSVWGLLTAVSLCTKKAFMFAGCAVAILAIAACSYLGVFEFGEGYTLIVLVAGLVVTVSPIVLIRPCHKQIFYR